MKHLIVSSLVVLISLFTAEYGGTIEGRLFPVITSLEIRDPSPFPPPDYRTIWRARAQQVRDCNFVRFEWYLGQRDGPQVVVNADVRFTDPPAVRGRGLIEWEGLIVALDPVRTRANSFADALHDCPFTPWLVRSPVYTARSL